MVGEGRWVRRAVGWWVRGWGVVGEWGGGWGGMMGQGG